jgi:hypothetical protein
MPLIIDHEQTLTHHLQSRLNLFLGAGFSVLARDRKGDSLPLGKALASELRSRFGLESLSGLDLPKLCTVIGSRDQGALREFLVDRFKVETFDNQYTGIERLPLDTIFSTNIDDLPHRIFEHSRSRYLNDLDFHGPVFKSRKAVDYIPLHGSILTPNRPLRFGTLDIATAFGTDPDRWRVLQNRLLRAPTLFWGYSLEDASTLEALAPYASGADRNGAWILVHPSAGPETSEYFRALNLQIIVGDTTELLAFVARVVPEASGPTGDMREDERRLFPNESLPALGQVPQRPIEEFFRGAAPVWSDIFSGLIPRTSHYARIRDAIYAKRHAVITGVPACGKTTLLMQLANTLDVDGYKLILDGLSPNRARWIARNLHGYTAYVFIDNYTDDVDAFSLLVETQGMVVVGADRDYNVSLTLNRLDRDRIAFFDATELTPQDLQACREAIPASIRRPVLVKPEVTEGVRPSLFEFIQANTFGPVLRDRFAEALRSLRRDSPQVADMLLMVAYVHSCRIPVSMDVALGFCYPWNLSYQQVYDLLSKVSAIVTEYKGYLAEEEQDYFAARSLLVAEVIMDAAPSGALKQLLSTFHENVSPYRIPRYQTFSRRAFDSSLIKRAFASVEDGAEFYDRAYARDQSPYLLQQKALFLSSRNRHTEAFQAIDRAKAEASPWNWTIRNSHAVILFRANIDFAGDSADVRDHLDASMQTLSECYNSDRRKAFHAMTFADQAIRYWDVYRDKTARDYLERAQRWLAEQRKREPWLERIQPLERIVAKRIHLNMPSN